VLESGQKEAGEDADDSYNIMAHGRLALRFFQLLSHANHFAIKIITNLLEAFFRLS
jgi:hypothetical protein